MTTPTSITGPDPKLAIDDGSDARKFKPGGFSFVPGEIGRIKIFGFWTFETAETYFHELAQFLKQVRPTGSGASILVDLTEAETQSQTVIKRTEEGNLRAFDDGDRIAIVASSALLKMQIGRMGTRALTRVFISPDAAVTWLRE